ncbi:MAG: hypothetical protein ACTHY4_07650 [Flavobacteriaceae bacterium]
MFSSHAELKEHGLPIKVQTRFGDTDVYKVTESNDDKKDKESRI